MPKKQIKLSMCMIARDEEESIGRCLVSVSSVADEIIVVDTGSKDKTVKIAREHGAQIIDFPWIDDFSAARNVGLEKAKGEWILFLDADEELVAEDIPKLRKALDQEAFPAHFMTIVTLLGEGEDLTEENTFSSLRLFKNFPEHRFTGRIHETITPRQPNDEAGVSNVRIRHYGRLSTEKNEAKAARNKPLIEQAGTDPDDPQHHKFLKANELRGEGEYEKAVVLYKELFDELAPENDTQLLPGIILDIVLCLRQLKQPKEVFSWIEEGLKRFPDYTDLEYLRGMTYRDTNQHELSLQSYTATLALGDAPVTYRRQEGLGSWKAWEGIAFSFIGLKRYDLAVASFRRVLETNPSHTTSIFHLGSLLMHAGHPWASVQGELTKICDSDAPAVKEVFERLSKSNESAL